MLSIVYGNSEEYRERVTTLTIRERLEELKETCPLDQLYFKNTVWATSVTNAILQENPDKNVFIAPTSISTALTLLLLGAEGNTKAELESVLYLNGIDSDDVFCHYQIWDGLVPSPELTLATASRIYIDESLNVTEKYQSDVNSASQTYTADFEKIDFKNQPEVSRRSINAWVAQQTKQHIKELFPVGSLSSSTAMAVTSAIYFQGLWQHPFDEETYVETFTVSPERQVQTEYMINFGMKTRYMEDVAGIDFIELPYSHTEGGFVISMIAFKANDFSGLSFQDVEDSLDNYQFLALAIENLLTSSTTEMNVKLPVMKMNGDYDLVDTLKNMGINDMFSPGSANLQGISDRTDLYVNEAKHKTFFQMDSKGSEAAGATGFAVMKSLSMPSSFFATKPFHFVIFDHYTHSILFSGRVYDPSL